MIFDIDFMVFEEVFDILKERMNYLVFGYICWNYYELKEVIK